MGRAWLPIVLAGLLAGCGLDVKAPDLFLLTRTGQGKRLQLLVSDGGTVKCNGGAAKQLPDPLLLQARDLAGTLDKDAKSRLSIKPTANSVFTYTVKLRHGTISFPDTAAADHQELAQLEQFGLLAAQRGCGLAS